MVDIVAIRIPEKVLKSGNKYNALVFADSIMKHNKQDKKYIKVQETLTNFIVYYEEIEHVANIIIKKFDNGVMFYIKC